MPCSANLSSKENGHDETDVHCATLSQRATFKTLGKRVKQKEEGTE